MPHRKKERPTWTTADRRTIFIDEMEDGHLLNTEQFLERSIRRAGSLPGFEDRTAFLKEKLEQVQTEIANRCVARVQKGQAPCPSTP